MNTVTLSQRMRRRFLINHFSLLTACFLFFSTNEDFSLAQTTNDNAKAHSWKTVITSKEEPGEPLIVSGTIYGKDGVTPLPNVLLYVYQTDAEGYYRKGNNSSDNPRLKGWMKTNAEGKYEFRTIKPGSYPGSRNPAHIHSKVTIPGRGEQWIDEFHFEGDPFLGETHVQNQLAKGKFSAVMRMRRDADGVIHCERDIKLEIK